MSSKTSDEVIYSSNVICVTPTPVAILVVNVNNTYVYNLFKLFEYTKCMAGSEKFGVVMDTVILVIFST